MRTSTWMFLFVPLALAGCPSDDGGGGGSSESGTSGDGGPTTASGSPTTMMTTADPTTNGDTSTGMMTTAADSSSGDGSSSSGGGGIVPGSLSFFVTSVGTGAMGGNLGGLAGADTICQTLADTAGSTYTWAAYLSTDDANARDRIGAGPWWNSMGDMVGMDVDQMHTDGVPNGDMGGGEPQYIYDENGDLAPMNEHDILTGSDEDGMLMAGLTCNNWTSDSGGDDARVGHSDIPNNPAFSRSWNSAHDSNGCNESGLQQTGGSGRLYCFATD